MRWYKLGAGVEHALGGLFDGVAVFVAEWFASEAGPRVVVVDDASGVAVAAFESAAYIFHPSHVHARGDDAEVESTRNQ